MFAKSRWKTEIQNKVRSFAKPQPQHWLPATDSSYTSARGWGDVNGEEEASGGGERK